MVDGIVGIGGRPGPARRRGGGAGALRGGARRRRRRAVRGRRRHRRLDGPHVTRRPDGHLRHPQDRPPRRPGRRGRAAWCTWSTSGSTCRRAPVEALQPVDVAALLPVPGAVRRTSTPAGWSAYAPGRRPTRAPRCCARRVRLRARRDGALLGLGGRRVRARHPEIVVAEGRVQAWVVGSGGDADAERGAGRRARRRRADGRRRRRADATCDGPHARPSCSPRTRASWPGCSASSATGRGRPARLRAPRRRGVRRRGAAQGPAHARRAAPTGGCG